MNKDRFIKFQSSIENTWVNRMTWKYICMLVK